MRLCPPDQTFETFLQHPESCICQLHQIENDNLFLIRHYQHLKDVLEHGLEKIQADIAIEIEAEEALVRDIESPTKILQTDLGAAVKPSQQDEDDPLARLERQVKKTYKGCFGMTVDLGSILMLKKIEIELESMYEKCDRVVPEFLAYKQTMRERQRRDEQRKEWQAWRAREQQRKMEQAIARAKRPMPVRTGRPLTMRRLPLKVKKQNDEAIRKLLLEQLQEEQLLYHDSDDEF
jgi:hypothetical protein